jgi:hypothetical protein
VLCCAAAGDVLCRWGGPNDFFTGHMANGKRVVIDGTKTTRHIIAGAPCGIVDQAAFLFSLRMTEYVDDCVNDEDRM